MSYIPGEDALSELEMAISRAKDILSISDNPKLKITKPVINEALAALDLSESLIKELSKVIHKE